jgi:hypothetical protein
MDGREHDASYAKQTTSHLGIFVIEALLLDIDNQVDPSLKSCYQSFIGTMNS